MNPDGTNVDAVALRDFLIALAATNGKVRDKKVGYTKVRYRKVRYRK